MTGLAYLPNTTEIPVRGEVAKSCDIWLSTCRQLLPDDKQRFPLSRE